MLRYLFSNPPDIAGLVIVSLVFIIALSLHEYGHALAAHLQGDPTAKLAGRLTVNPKSHLDPVGTFMLVLVGFGWGKPVPFAPNKLRSKRFGAAMVGAAGPLVNVLLALVSAAAFLAFFRRASDLDGGNQLLARFLLIGVTLNVTLALFNLLPIPPLDGSRILSALLPPSKQHIVFFLDKWGFVILLLVGFVLFPRLAGPLIDATSRLIFLIVGA
ncbi:MAG TPA: site-2 protease family protein [Actinomycetota bacterium]|nr:site-2 protease family protein [Actinomycetota bacterium]